MDRREVGAAVKAQQVMWARERGHTIDDRGYLADVEANLLHPLRPETKSEFKFADGSELEDRPGAPAKMRALHSSSALAVNFFDHWRSNPGPLGAVLGLDEDVSDMAFEVRCPTGLPGTPPNLDLVLTLRSGAKVGVESKFTELYSPKPKGSPFKDKYFALGVPCWGQHGLARCQAVAERLHAGVLRFAVLNAGQLLKHLLGLVQQYGRPPRLVYLYFESAGAIGDAHRQDIQAFASAIGTDAVFSALSYQEAFRRLPDSTAGTYRDYLADRYFRVAHN